MFFLYKIHYSQDFIASSLAIIIEFKNISKLHILSINIYIYLCKLVACFFQCTHPPANACEIYFNLKYEKSGQTKENCQPP